jgi:hypothetical protein
VKSPVPINRPAQRLSLSAILRTWADFIDETVCVLSRGESISISGKRCLTHAADRMREAAEVLQ